MTRKTMITQSAVPQTPGEAAAASASWARRGILGRLVRLDSEVAFAGEQRYVPRTSRPAPAPFSSVSQDPELASANG